MKLRRVPSVNWRWCKNTCDGETHWNYCGFFESLFKNIYEMHSWSKFLGFTLTEFWRRISLGWYLKFRLVSSVNWRWHNNVCRGVMCYVLPVLLALLENIQGTFALPLLLPPHFQNLVGGLNIDIMVIISQFRLSSGEWKLCQNVKSL